MLHTKIMRLERQLQQQQQFDLGNCCNNKNNDCRGTNEILTVHNNNNNENQNNNNNNDGNDNNDDADQKSMKCLGANYFNWQTFNGSSINYTPDDLVIGTEIMQEQQQQQPPDGILISTEIMQEQQKQPHDGILIGTEIMKEQQQTIIPTKQVLEQDEVDVYINVDVVEEGEDQINKKKRKQQQQDSPSLCATNSAFKEQKQLGYEDEIMTEEDKKRIAAAMAAFRSIEAVHNYAKLQDDEDEDHYLNSDKNRASYTDDDYDDDDDDDDDDNDDEEEDEEEYIDNNVDEDDDYNDETYGFNIKKKNVNKNQTVSSTRRAAFKQLRKQHQQQQSRRSHDTFKNNNNNNDDFKASKQTTTKTTKRPAILKRKLQSNQVKTDKDASTSVSLSTPASTEDSEDHIDVETITTTTTTQRSDNGIAEKKAKVDYERASVVRYASKKLNAKATATATAVIPHTETQPNATAVAATGMAICTTTTNNNGNLSENHARRPMNAFLIFCKRHRAIVKERYKSLENRAITKVLGDWWASLDENEKQCFTNLAQKNKDAFFSANPNFKWYKLPAPPLRTLTTRPSSVIQNVEQGAQQQPRQSHDYLQDNLNDATGNGGPQLLTTATTKQAGKQKGNYFKLAEETQMGKLNRLMDVGGVVTVTATSTAKDNHNQNDALQVILTETKDYLTKPAATRKRKLLSGTVTKAPVSSTSTNHNNNNISSSDDERFVPYKKQKSSRRCKGKIYQQLIDSGSIVSIGKKVKSTATPTSTIVKPQQQEQQQQQGQSVGDQQQQRQLLSSSSSSSSIFENTNSSSQPRTLSECSSTSDFGMGIPMANGNVAMNFDLEEKIKELPALSLDAYLQRKRNTNKKKKFSSTTNKHKHHHRRGSNNATATNSAAGNSCRVTSTTSATLTTSMKFNQQQQQQKIDKAETVGAASPGTSINNRNSPVTALAVGSQKRKARKESITRRDLSIFENGRLRLPLTVNGIYYYESPSSAPTADEAIDNMLMLTSSSSNEQQQQQEQGQLNNASLASPLLSSLSNSSNSMSSSSASASASTATPMSFGNLLTRGGGIGVDGGGDRGDCGRDGDGGDGRGGNVVGVGSANNPSDLLILAEVAACSTELNN